MKPDPVKEKIQSLCPDVMELKFGCHVIVRGIREDNPGCENDVVVDERIKDGKITLGYFGQVPLSEIETVLGSPITLAVVLSAIKKNRFPGHVLKWVKITNAWNLSKDNYDDQDEATKAFIGSLILN